jgi:hypothetical protein
MGIWPGDDYFASRYDYLTEYVQVLRDLWGTGRSDFKGDYFTMNDCRVSPQPSQPMKVICAGQSDAGWPSPPSTPTTTSASAKGSIRRPPLPRPPRA